MTDRNVYELLYMIRMKSAEALEELFRMYRKGIEIEVNQQIARYRVITAFHDDIVLEAQIGLMRAVEYYRFDQGCAFTTFVWLVVRRRISQYARRLRLSLMENGATSLSLDYETELNPHFSNLIAAKESLNDPVFRMRYNEASRRVREAAAKLNADEKRVLSSWIEGGTYAVCSERIGITCRQYERKLAGVKKKMIAAAKGQPELKRIRKTQAC